MTEYIPTIGLEVHVQLATKSKMFCRCNNDAEGKEPNTVVCPLCMGFPGVLPVANETAMKWGVKTALALGCTINKFQRFDRKNYFYPDLPKAYQISQFFFPVGENGKVKVDHLGVDRKTKHEFEVGITRLHLEEDAGKLIHAKDATLVDFNRCGTPLAEIVTEPDIETPEQARAFALELQRIVRALGVSHANMEKGQLRIDANVSVRPKGQKELGAKVEVKNMNSFKFMEQALKFEIKRQIEALEAGEKIDQETRGWDEKTSTTISQRGKEGAIDYRYFPEPDLPPTELTDKQIKDWGKQLGSLPTTRRAEAEKLGLSYDRVSELQDKDKLAMFVEVMRQSKDFNPTQVANWIEKFDNTNKLIKFMEVVIKDKLSTSAAQKYLETGEIPKSMDESTLGKIVSNVLNDNPEAVEQFKAEPASTDADSGKESKVLGWLTGQIMAKTKGEADPALVQQILKKLLTK